MNVLVVNCGSSSLKFQLINYDNRDVLAKGLCERIAIVGGAINEAWRVTYGIEEQITALVSRYERRLT